VRKLPHWIFTALSKGHFDFIVSRADLPSVKRYSVNDAFDGSISHADHIALAALYNTRIQQQLRFLNELKLGILLNSYVISEKSDKERPLLFGPVELNSLVLDYVGYEDS
jgi:hypothetical protein